MSENNYFKQSATNPYHVSIGAVAFDEQGRIGCHYFKEIVLPGIGTFTDLYILMRETIHTHETIEQCLARGLMEEFGAVAELQSYVGSIVSNFPSKSADQTIEKTTLYFRCMLQSFNEASRIKDDIEGTSTVLWLPPPELLEKMKNQKERYGREDVDESIVIKRALKYQQS